MTMLGTRAAGIATRLQALDEVLALAPGRIDAAAITEAERIAAKAGERLRIGAEHTVVALAGTTGSGKSSLFNALVGSPLSQVGMRRPTTAAAHAAVWGDGDAADLLDWLDVPQRHVVGAKDSGLDGLVLVDLPDIDSVDSRHRHVADRLIERVDLLVWVVDPQKYADASLHDRYLATLAGHAGVMVVVLNQVDRLPAHARAGCLADLQKLLRSDGLGAVALLPVSAMTGDGLGALRHRLGERVSARRSMVRRLEADLAALAGQLDDPRAGASTGGVGRAEREALVAALGDAAGVELVADAVSKAYRLRARRATGWPLSRWLARLRRDPAKRLRLPDSPSELIRTSLPGPSAVQRARVDTALRELSDRAAGDLPEPWPAAVRRAAMSRRDDLPEMLDRAVAGTDLGLSRRPRWWRGVGWLQLLLFVVAAAGAAWLLVLFGLDLLRLPQPPLPTTEGVPLPTLLLAGGLLVGLVLGLVSGGFARFGGARRAGRARRLLRARVERVADESAVVPVQRELAAHRSLTAALRTLHG